MQIEAATDVGGHDVHDENQREHPRHCTHDRCARARWSSGDQPRYESLGFDVVRDSYGAPERARNGAFFSDFTSNVLQLCIVELLQSFNHSCEMRGLNADSVRILFRGDDSLDGDSLRTAASLPDERTQPDAIAGRVRGRQELFGRRLARGIPGHAWDAGRNLESAATGSDFAGAGHHFTYPSKLSASEERTHAR
jgi:hypothetical protein